MLRCRGRCGRHGRSDVRGGGQAQRRGAARVVGGARSASRAASEAEREAVEDRREGRSFTLRSPLAAAGDPVRRAAGPEGAKQSARGRGVAR